MQCYLLEFELFRPLFTRLTVLITLFKIHKQTNHFVLIDRIKSKAKILLFELIHIQSGSFILMFVLCWLKNNSGNKHGKEV